MVSGKDFMLHLFATVSNPHPPPPPPQMAMQIAYYRLHQKFVLTYESATTRLYYEGRTETIRPVSDESVAFVKSFDDPTVSRDNVKKMLKKAIE